MKLTDFPRLLVKKGFIKKPSQKMLDDCIDWTIKQIRP